MATIDLTISVPDGTLTHDTPNLICAPARWYSFVAFFLFNYAAHAFTVFVEPGATNREKSIAILYALFVPASGIIRSARWIFAFAARPAPNSFEKAARAGALCMILHKRNIGLGPYLGFRRDRFRNVFADRDVRLVPINRTVHANMRFPTRYPKTYFLVEVPPGTPMSTMKRYRQPPPPRVVATPPKGVVASLWGVWHSIWNRSTTGDIEMAANTNPTAEEQASTEAEELLPDSLTLANNWNVPQVLISLAQSVYAVYTLYKAMGNQVSVYGFSAFGLTVAPYALMSFVNIVATLATPQYPTMFLIETDDLAEAENDGGRFVGAIAKVKYDELDRKVEPDFLAHAGFKTFAHRLTVGVLILAPIGIVGGLSRFRFVTPGNTLLQRVSIPLWIFVGCVSALWLKWVDNLMALHRCQFSLHGADEDSRKFYRWWSFSVILLTVPPIVGMISVGLMLKEYGACTKLDFDWDPF